jgi:hypothetical protein
MSTQINMIMRLLALTVLTATPVVARADDDLEDDSRRDAHDEAGCGWSWSGRMARGGI